ncbi:PLP-dependent aminotransferase family protein [Effusibacillus consociatus]|uniref:PLP-dependent aminotransferase family protein n=1 Tax=Effusibacillus consociatus TaxID=1117041 RepID=A0ABV9PXT2_9BACL
MGRKSIYQTVYNRLRYQILSGEWPIGSPLPPERKLADEWGVSRNTIVRAYGDLEAEGLIFSKIGSGRYVQPVPPLPEGVRFQWRDQLSPYPSYMAELLSSFGKESAINFSLGDGGKHMLEISDFQKYVKQVAEKAESYYFLPINGHPQLREWAVSWMGFDQVTSPEQVVITSGSQEALQITTAVLAEPGDAIAVEMPTYFGALQLFQSLGIRIIPIPIDREGMNVDVLEGVLARYRPRFVYTVPTFQNPTGYTMSLARRQRLLELSEKYGFPIVEDDAYRHLQHGAEPPAPLKSMDRQGNVIYINTFSKILFPGLRLGWVAGSRSFIQLVTRRKELSITTNTLGQHALLSFLQDGCLPGHLERCRQLYRKQADVMGRFLDSLTPLGISFEPTAGGFYYWVSLPEGIQPKEILKESISGGVLFAPGDMFLARETDQPFIRLCYSYENSEQIEAGMEILTSILRTRKEMSA